MIFKKSTKIFLIIPTEPLEMKNTVSEMKHKVDGINSRLATEDEWSWTEIQTIKSETRKWKEKEKHYEQNIRELCGTSSSPIYMLLESPKEEKGELKKVFEIMPPIFLSISENYKLTDTKALIYSKHK